MVIITGMGEMSFKSGCAIVLQDGSRVHTPVHHPSTTMDDSNLYNLIQQYPTNTNITIPIPEIIETPLTHLSAINFTMTGTNSVQKHSTLSGPYHSWQEPSSSLLWSSQPFSSYGAHAEDAEDKE